MTLTYKNYAKDHILHNLRNIRYANTEMMFGFYNNISVDLELQINVSNLYFQADLFARELMSHRSVIDFKKILGSYQEDWMRILIETYVYDRLKCIYYGINSKYMLSIPDNLISFPGNILLMNALSINSFNFSTNDAQPFNLYLNIKHKNNVNDLFETVFSISPDLKEGMSDVDGIYSYVNFTCESVLKGLHNFKNMKMSRGQNSNNNSNKNNKISNLYFTNKMNDETIRSCLLDDSNPLLNSFFSKDFGKFFFIMPIGQSVPEALRFNESLFISRALHFTSDQLEISDNNIYTVSKVNSDIDRLVREDVYSITGVKTEIVNYSMELIKEKLSINSYKREDLLNSTKKDQP